ncbi:MAG: gamma-glutamylcyclotransferase family protein [Novosphingobium sp.]
MKLFFYGTLRPDADTPMARWVAARLVRTEPGRVPGRLYAVRDPRGWYPALVPGSGRVGGVLCELQLRPGDLARLDAYEGREYRRLALPVRTSAGRVTAQAYIWRKGLPDGRPIGADFVEWLRGIRGTPYS